jgi:hypothetical protein
VEDIKSQASRELDGVPSARDMHKRWKKVYLGKYNSKRLFEVMLAEADEVAQISRRVVFTSRLSSQHNNGTSLTSIYWPTRQAVSDTSLLLAFTPGSIRPSLSALY